MTIAAPSSTQIDQTESATAPSEAVPDTSSDAFFDAKLPDGYDAILADGDIQFAPLQPKVVEPSEPGWLAEMIGRFFAWLGEIFGPIGGAFAGSWSVIQWVLLGLLALFVIYCLVRFIGPLANRTNSVNATAEPEPEWQPDRAESLALLEDADELAAKGRFDEAARLLLQRSVGQIAAAKPDWVEPSSTARELAALPRLSQSARNTFGVISEAVERSLFALKTLNRDDWEVARAAYADFALSRIEAGNEAAVPAPGITA